MTRAPAIALALLLSSPAVVMAQEADLQIVANPLYDADGSVRVQATVTNAGPDDVSDIDIAAQFDADSVTTSELEPGCSNSSVGVVCSFTELEGAVLAVDEALAVEFVVSPTVEEGEVALSVTSSVTDPDESNNSDTFPLVPPTTVDVSIDERGEQAPDVNTLIFAVRNDGPDTAAGLAVAGTVTVDFLEELGREGADARTRITSNDDALCGRRVDDAEGTFDRWTFPVTCSVRDLDPDEEIEFRFEFEGGDNAVFRLTATSDGLDTDASNNVTDGNFLNSPLEVVEGEDDGGCCATVRRRELSPIAVLLLIALAVRRRRS